MKAFIARFSGCTGAVEPGQEGDADGEVAQAAAVELGRAPPCELYSSLKPISVVENAVEKYNTATNPAHVKERHVFLTIVGAAKSKLYRLESWLVCRVG